jgi:hypothetical protein
MLRWVTPIQNMNRTAPADVELRGERVRKGDKLLLLYGSANRDEAVFAAPERFDVTRDPNPHLAFGGYGTHHCLGAALARLELRVMFEELLAALPDLALASDAPLPLPLRPSPHRGHRLCRSLHAEGGLMPELSGKVAFVTAGATGIGFGCAESIVASGGQVMICARREDTLREAVLKLGSNAAWVACDVTDDKSVDDAVAATVRRFGALHLAVNAAGTGTAAPILKATTSEWRRTLATNLTGPFRCVRAEARAMVAAGGGSIVNVSSIAGALTHPWMSAYCVSKAGSTCSRAARPTSSASTRSA